MLSLISKASLLNYWENYQEVLLRFIITHRFSIFLYIYFGGTRQGMRLPRLLLAVRQLPLCPSIPSPQFNVAHFYFEGEIYLLKQINFAFDIFISVGTSRSYSPVFCKYPFPTHGHCKQTWNRSLHIYSLSTHE